MTTPHTSVIILNFNGEKLLKTYLPSVIAHTPAEAELIVADNGSTDGSLALLAEEFPQVKVMKFDKNYGFAGGYNKALSQVTTPYTLLLNSDIRVEDDYVTPLYDFMQSHPGCVACQPKILSDRYPEQFEYAGAAGGFLDKDGYPYCRGRIFDVVEQDKGQYDEPMQVDWATGAALMVRTRDYVEAGGLDNSFFAHMEEVDLCWCLRLTGKQIWAVPQAKVYHLGGGSLAMGDPRKTYLNFRNSLLMLHKNLPDKCRKKRLFRRRMLDMIAWSKFCLTGKLKHAGSIYRAHMDYKKWRKAYTPAFKPEKNLLEGKPSILWQHYARRKKHFSAL